MDIQTEVDSALAPPQARRGTVCVEPPARSALSPSRQRRRVGDEPAPGYRLTGFLGAGSFGEVWKADGPGRVAVAIKVVPLERRQALKEFRALKLIRNVKHVNLVGIQAFWVKDASGRLVDDSLDNIDVLLAPSDGAGSRGRGVAELIVAMTLCDRNLLDRLAECERSGSRGIPHEELLGYMHDAAKAIDFLNSPVHNLGAGPAPIHHLDIKPANIMLLGGAAVVGDFTLARTAQANDLRRTQIGGSTAYISPEARLHNSFSPSSDQYSLAITYYELRTGKLPFPEDSSLPEIRRRVECEELDFSALDSHERAVVRRATSLDPARRYASSSELARELRLAIAQSTAGGRSARPVPGGELPETIELEAPEWPQRRGDGRRRLRRATMRLASACLAFGVGLAAAYASLSDFRSRVDGWGESLRRSSDRHAPSASDSDLPAKAATSVASTQSSGLLADSAIQATAHEPHGSVAALQIDAATVPSAGNASQSNEPAPFSGDLPPLADIDLADFDPAENGQGAQVDAFGGVSDAAIEPTPAFDPQTVHRLESRARDAMFRLIEKAGQTANERWHADVERWQWVSSVSAEALGELATSFPVGELAAAEMPVNELIDRPNLLPQTQQSPPAAAFARLRESLSAAEQSTERSFALAESAEPSVAGAWQTVLDRCDTALAGDLSPRDTAEAMLGRARAYLGLRQPGHARDELRRATAALPADAADLQLRARVLLAYALLQAGEHARALELTERLAAAPANGPADALRCRLSIECSLLVTHGERWKNDDRRDLARALARRAVELAGDVRERQARAYAAWATVEDCEHGDAATFSELRRPTVLFREAIVRGRKLPPSTTGPWQARFAKLIDKLESAATTDDERRQAGELAIERNGSAE